MKKISKHLNKALKTFKQIFLKDFTVFPIYRNTFNIFVYSLTVFLFGKKIPKSFSIIKTSEKVLWFSDWKEIKQNSN